MALYATRSRKSGQNLTEESADMALTAVHQRIRDIGSEHLLEVLPDYNSMRWVAHPEASPPKALVIGSVDGNDILAFCKQFGEKAREIRYCSKPRHVPVNKRKPNIILQDEVVEMNLNAPFKYNAGSSKSEKRRFSIIIKYYFLVSGLIQDSGAGDIADYCKRFVGALQKIQLAQEPGRGLDKPEKTYGKGTRVSARVVNESPDSTRTRNSHSGDETNSSPTRTESASEESPEELESDYMVLKNYLDRHNCLYLLGNLPEPDEVQFALQDGLDDAQPSKLFIGKHAETGEEIYAYMRKTHARHHEIRFFIGPNDPDDSQKPMRVDEVARQNILHPFNKTYPKDAETLEQLEKSRLTLLVKWYFLAAQVARNVVLKETREFPYRFKTALEYIAKRMGEASVQPRRGLSNEPTDVTEQTVDSHVDEGHIQSDLNANQSVASQSPEAIRVAALPSNETVTPRGTKRTAEDAGFEDLKKLIKEDENLTEEIEGIDQNLEMLEIQRQQALKTRMELDAQRKEVRKRFKRQSLVFAREPSVG